MPRYKKETFKKGRALKAFLRNELADNTNQSNDSVIKFFCFNDSFIAYTTTIALQFNKSVN